MPRKAAVISKKIEFYKQSARAIVYIDESGFAYDMLRKYSYSLKGERCFGSHDWGAKGRKNARGALIDKHLLTVALIKCHINTETFSAWVKQELLPVLPSQSVIVMDNASFHKGKWLKEKIELNGYTLEYLPPYPPDLNPIEYQWAQAKRDIDQLFTNFNL